MIALTKIEEEIKERQRAELSLQVDNFIQFSGPWNAAECCRL